MSEVTSRAMRISRLMMLDSCSMAKVYLAAPGTAVFPIRFPCHSLPKGEFTSKSLSTVFWTEFLLNPSQANLCRLGAFAPLCCFGQDPPAQYFCLDFGRGRYGTAQTLIRRWGRRLVAHYCGADIKGAWWNERETMQAKQVVKKVSSIPGGTRHEWSFLGNSFRAVAIR